MSSANNGIVTLPSHHSVEDTVEKVQGILQAKGVALFALVDRTRRSEEGRNEDEA